MKQSSLILRFSDIWSHKGVRKPDVTLLSKNLTRSDFGHPLYFYLKFTRRFLMLNFKGKAK